jgi:uncharacterized protein (TIGR03790 family)
MAKSRPGTVLVLFLVAASSVLACGGPQNLVVVVNEESRDSLDVASHYGNARKLPGACFCFLRLKPAHDISRTDYEEKILKPVLEHIEKNGLKEHTRCIVFTMGLPYRILWNASTKVAVTTPAATGSMDIGHMKKQPYYREATCFRGKPGMPYLSVCLTGYTVEDVKRCIDQGVASDATFPKGTVYLFDGVGPRARVHPRYGRPEAVEGLKKYGIKTEVRPKHSLKDEKDVLGYWTGAVRVNTKNIVFLPGALADHLTSFGGILFNNKSQMSILDFIKAGATGSYGTVMEPTNIHTRHSKGWVFCRYASGLSLAESYWSCVQDVQIGVFVGEPLARPFAKKPEVKAEGPGAKSICSGEILLKITASPSKEGVRFRDLSWWVDGRPFGPALSHAKAEGTEVTLTVGDRAFKETFQEAEGVEGLARALAKAVDGDAELAKPEGVKAEAVGKTLFIEARLEGDRLNGTKVKVEIAPPEGGAQGVEVKAEPGMLELSGGAETKVVPAHVELTVNGKKMLEGDSVTIASGGETYSATVDAEDLGAPSPVVSFVRKLLAPMKDSKIFREPKARVAGTRAVITLFSIKEAEEGNGTEVVITVKKQKGTKFSAWPAGTRVMEGGVVRRFFAKARIDLFTVFEGFRDLETVFDTTALGDGYHRLRLVAEEDTEVSAQGFAFTEIKVGNGKGRLRLAHPRRFDPSKPFWITARISGRYPGAVGRIALLVDDSEVAEVDRRKRKILFDAAKFPVGAGSHRFQLRVHPKKEGYPTVTSEPVVIELPPISK